MQESLFVHETESGYSNYIFLEEKFARRLSGYDSEESFEIGKFCKMKLSIVQGLGEVIEGKISLCFGLK